jgi:hypothetical protein
MANPIVTVLVSQQQAPTPNQLQKTGAMISQGGTILPVGSTTLIQQPSDLNAILDAPLALTTVVWGAAYGGQVTATAAAPLGVPAGTRFQTVIAGVVPGGYNGAVWAFATGASQFTYSMPINPGAQTQAGTYSGALSGELNSMVTTFFAQGFQQGVYVLELGPGTPAEGVATLQAFINSNDQMFYSYLVPRNWDGDPTFLAFLANYESTTSKTYFFVTTTLQNYSLYQPSMKDVVALVEAPQYHSWARNLSVSTAWAAGLATHTMTSATGVQPGDWVTMVGFTPAGYNGTFQAQPGTTASALVVPIPVDPGTVTVQGSLAPSVYTSAGVTATEFSMAAAWWVTLNYSPGQTSRVPPYSYSFLKGVTKFPSQGNQVAMAALKAANINIVGFGAEGGISDTILLYGHTLDGKPWNYWYSVDWMQINIDLNIANAIINGSNTTVNPLYYNQDGINRLATVASATGASAISFGLALGRVVQLGINQQDFLVNLNNGQYAGTLVVNADPFTNYLTANPSHYAQGLYGGLTMAYTPLRGFEHIIFSIIATDFVASA